LKYKVGNSSVNRLVSYSKNMIILTLSEGKLIYLKNK
jgi:hypothetical protein